MKNRKRLLSFLMCFALLSSFFVGIPQQSNAFQFANKNVTVVYDGEYHSPIIVTDQTGISYTYVDENSGEEVTAYTLPKFKKVGTHSVVCKTTGNITMTITAKVTILTDATTEIKDGDYTLIYSNTQTTCTGRPIAPNIVVKKNGVALDMTDEDALLDDMSITFFYKNEATGEDEIGNSLPSFVSIDSHVVNVDVIFNGSEEMHKIEATLVIADQEEEQATTKVTTTTSTQTVTTTTTQTTTGQDNQDSRIKMLTNGTASSAVQSFFREAYEEVLNASNNNSTWAKFDVTSYNLDPSSDEYKAIAKDIAYDLYSDYADTYKEYLRPERYFMSADWGYNLTDDGKVKEFVFYYNENVDRTHATVWSTIQKMEAAKADVTRFYDSLTSNPTREEAILAIHDAMAMEFAFAYDDYQENGGADDALHTSAGVLANRKGLCDGYAYVFKYFMDEFGIPCQVVYSKKLNHMWNMVQIVGQWYHVDVSWDDLVMDSDTFTNTFDNVAFHETMYGDEDEDFDNLGHVSHRYFLKTDSEMKSFGYSDWVAYFLREDVTSESLTNVSATEPVVGSVHTGYEGNLPYVNHFYYVADPSGFEENITKCYVDGSDPEIIETDTIVRYLQTDGTYLYYTDGEGVIRCDLDGNNVKFADLKLTGDYQITEFVIQNSKLVCNVQATRNTKLVKPLNQVVWLGATDEEDATTTAQIATTQATATTQAPASQSSTTTNAPATTQASATTQVIQSSNGVEEIIGNVEEIEEEETDYEEGDVIKSDTAKYVIADAEDHELIYAKNRTKSKTVIIPDYVRINGVVYKVIEVSAKAFLKSTALQKVTVGDNIETINSEAFSNCKKLKTVKIGNHVEHIDAKAFNKCESLTSIEFPKSVESIGSKAFYACKNLKKIHFKSTKPPKIGKKAFTGIAKKAVFRAPSKGKKKYKSTLNSKVGVKKSMKVK